MIDVNHRLRQRYVLDLKKPEIDIFERAEIIRAIMEEEGLSVRQYAEKNGMAKSTVDDYLLYNRISEEEYKRQIAKGIGKETIYRNLRHKKTEPPTNYDIDLFFQEIKVKSKHFRNNDTPVSPKTALLVEETIDELRHLASNILMKQKKGLK